MQREQIHLYPDGVKQYRRDYSVLPVYMFGMAPSLEAITNLQEESKELSGEKDIQEAISLVGDIGIIVHEPNGTGILAPDNVDRATQEIEVYMKAGAFIVKMLITFPDRHLSSVDFQKAIDDIENNQEIEIESTEALKALEQKIIEICDLYESDEVMVVLDEKVSIPRIIMGHDFYYDQKDYFSRLRHQRITIRRPKEDDYELPLNIEQWTHTNSDHVAYAPHVSSNPHFRIDDDTGAMYRLNGGYTGWRGASSSKVQPIDNMEAQALIATLDYIKKDREDCLLQPQYAPKNSIEVTLVESLGSKSLEDLKLIITTNKSPFVQKELVSQILSAEDLSLIHI